VHRGVGVGVPPGASPTLALQPRRVSLQVRAPPRPALPPFPMSDASISLSLRTRKLAQADAAGAVVGGGGGRQGDPRRQGRARRGHVDGVHEGREARLSYQRAGARLDHRRQDQRTAPRQVSPGSTLSNFVTDFYLKRWHDDGGLSLDYRETCSAYAARE